MATVDVQIKHVQLHKRERTKSRDHEVHFTHIAIIVGDAFSLALMSSFQVSSLFLSCTLNPKKATYLL